MMDSRMRIGLSLLILVFVSLQRITAMPICVWCDKDMQKQFLDCMHFSLSNSPIFPATSQDIIDDTCNSLVAFSSNMRRTSAANKRRIINDMMVGELSALVTSVGGNVEISTNEVIGVTGKCYKDATGDFSPHFINEFEVMVRDVVRDFLGSELAPVQRNNNAGNSVPPVAVNGVSPNPSAVNEPKKDLNPPILPVASSIAVASSNGPQSNYDFPSNVQSGTPNFKRDLPPTIANNPLPEANYANPPVNPPIQSEQSTNGVKSIASVMAQNNFNPAPVETREEDLVFQQNFNSNPPRVPVRSQINNMPPFSDVNINTFNYNSPPALNSFQQSSQTLETSEKPLPSFPFEPSQLSSTNYFPNGNADNYVLKINDPPYLPQTDQMPLPGMKYFPGLEEVLPMDNFRNVELQQQKEDQVLDKPLQSQPNYREETPDSNRPPEVDSLAKNDETGSHEDSFSQSTDSLEEYDTSEEIYDEEPASEEETTSEEKSPYPQTTSSETESFNNSETTSDNSVLRDSDDEESTSVVQTASNSESENSNQDENESYDYDDPDVSYEEEQTDEDYEPEGEDHKDDCEDLNIDFDEIMEDSLWVAESNKHLNTLMSSARICDRPSGFDFDGFSSAISSVISAIHSDHPKWSQQKVSLKGYSLSFVALTELLQDKTFPNRSHL